MRLLLVAYILITAISVSLSKSNHENKSTRFTVEDNSEKSQKRVGVFSVILGLGKLLSALISRKFAASKSATAKQRYEKTMGMLEGLESRIEAKFDWTNQMVEYSDAFHRCRAYGKELTRKLAETTEGGEPTPKAKAEAETILGHDDFGADKTLAKFNSMIMGKGGLGGNSILEVFPEVIDKTNVDYVMNVAEFFAYIFITQHSCYQAWIRANEIIPKIKYNVKEKYDRIKDVQKTFSDEILAKIKPYHWGKTVDVQSLTAKNIEKKDGKIICQDDEDGEFYGGYVAEGKSVCMAAYADLSLLKLSTGATGSQYFKVLYKVCSDQEIEYINKSTGTHVLTEDGKTLCRSPYSHVGTARSGKCLVARPGIQHLIGTKRTPIKDFLSLACPVEKMFNEKYSKYIDENE